MIFQFFIINPGIRRFYPVDKGIDAAKLRYFCGQVLKNYYEALLILAEQLKMQQLKKSSFVFRQKLYLCFTFW
jgi:hypothetical protein